MSRSAEDLAAKLGITVVPHQWEDQFEAFREWLDCGGCELAASQLPGGAVELFDLPPEAVPEIEEACRQIPGDSALSELAALYHYLLFHAQPGGYLSESALPLPQTGLGNLAPMFRVCVIVSGAAHCVEAYRTLHVADDIRDATLAQAGFYLRDHMKRHGSWGCAYLGWMRRHLRAQIFRLGRLLFNRAPCDWPFRIYTHRESGQVAALAEPGHRFRAGILSDGSAEPDAWTSDLVETSDWVEGHATTPGGLASEPVTRLSKEQWSLVAAPGCEIVEVHIAARAAAGSLSEDACRASYRQALELFPRIYPGYALPMFTCFSWLLDPALPELLPPHSNIVRFQQPYHLLPMRGGDEQTFDLVFGCLPAEADTATRETSLQRAILDYVARGNRMGSAGGCITWGEAQRRYG